MKKPILILPAVLYFSIAILPLLFSCTKETNHPEDIYNTRGIAAVANNNFNLTLFTFAVQTTGYTATLSQAGPYTVLAPSNQAFNAFGLTSGQGIVDAAGDLSHIIPYHIYTKAISFDTLSPGFNKVLKMKNGTPLYVSRWINARDTAVTVNGVRIESKGLETTNGIIHVIEKVLKPTAANNLREVIANNPNLTFFDAAIARSGLAGLFNSTDNYTVFAPTNAAFTTMGINSIDSIFKMEPTRLQEILKAHITKGRNFLYDYIMKADVTTNRYTETLLDQTTMTIILKPDPQRPGRFNGVTLSKTYGPGSTFNAAISIDNISAANGVVHSITSILTP